MAKAATTTKPKARAATPTKRSKAPAKKAKAAAPKKKWKSRAVTRLIEAGSMADCSHCEERVKFKAREKNKQVICNVYVKGTWDRVEHFHEPCYAEAGEPYGAPAD